MVNRQALKGKIVEQGYNLSSFADAIEMPRATFARRMKKGVFGSDEIEKMIKILDIDDPMPIFFTDEVT